MRRQHRELLEERMLDGKSRIYILKCGNFKKRKAEHKVEFKEGHIIFHGHACCTSLTAVMQEFNLANGNVALQGCAYLANLVMRVSRSGEYVKTGYSSKKRTSEMVEAEDAGLPPAIYLEVQLIADRRRDHHADFGSKNTGEFGKWPLEPLHVGIVRRARHAIELNHKRNIEKMQRVAHRLREKGVKIDERYGY